MKYDMRRKYTFSDAVRVRIRRLYRKEKYSMRECALKAKIPYTTLNSYMIGETNTITLRTLHKICNGLNINLHDFFDDELFDNENIKRPQEIEKK